MKIIVGLGNPGRRYKNTRHNMGFEVIEEIARRCPVNKEESKYDAIIGHITVNQEKALLVKPLTYMNLSGKAVQPLVKFYKINYEDLLVIYDDMDLELGRVRIRASGSSGGHKGIGSIINCLGVKDFPRIRIGISRPPEGWNVQAWVLSEILPPERKILEESINKAADAAIYWLNNDIVQTMNKFN